MAQPLDSPGAIQSAERPFRRELSDLRTPSTKVERFTFSQSGANSRLRWSSGMSQWLVTGMRSASGKRSRITWP